MRSHKFVRAHKRSLPQNLPWDLGRDFDKGSYHFQDYYNLKLDQEHKISYWKLLILNTTEIMILKVSVD